MATLESPEELYNYALRKLGAPVINIEIDDDQAYERIEDAMQYFIERHYDGTEEVYGYHTITAADVTNGYLTLPDDIVVVSKVFPSGGYGGSWAAQGLGSYEKTAMEEMYFGGARSSLVDWHLNAQHISLVERLFVPEVRFGYNEAGRRLRFAVQWELTEGSFIVYKGHRAIDPDTISEVYNHRWVKEYATTLLKQQWGTNIKKFDGVQLPGGITMNGQKIYDEATEELIALREQFSLEFELPVDMVWA